MTKMPLLLAAVLCLLAGTALSEIKTLTLNFDGRSQILLDEFGFTHTGHVSISVDHIAVESFITAAPDPGQVGFVLVSDIGASYLRGQPRCLLNSSYAIPIFTFQEFSPISHSYHVTTAPTEYSLYFINCARLTAVTMTVRTELYNLDGASRDYLSTTQTNVPSFLFSSSVVYFSLLGFWICLCIFRKALTLRIHLIMAGLLLIKALGLLCAFELKSTVKVAGSPHGWDGVLFVFRSMEAVTLLTVLVLITGGWSLVRASPRGNKNLLKTVIVVQVAAAVITGSRKVLCYVDFLSCTLIFFVATDGRCVMKPDIFKNFWRVVIGYFCLTRIEIFVNPKYVTEIMEITETVALAFYLVIFYMFRPTEVDEKNSYFLLKDEVEAAELMKSHHEELHLDYA